MTGEAVAAAAHRELEAVLAGERDRGRDVVGALGLRDHRGAAVDVAVPERPGVVVTGVARDEQITGERLAE